MNSEVISLIVMIGNYRKVAGREEERADITVQTRGGEWRPRRTRAVGHGNDVARPCRLALHTSF